MTPHDHGYDPALVRKVQGMIDAAKSDGTVGVNTLWLNVREVLEANGIGRYELQKPDDAIFTRRTEAASGGMHTIPTKMGTQLSPQGLISASSQRQYRWSCVR